VLTLTAGTITTSSYELQVTNTSVSSITGYSSSNYIVGNLRRSVAASGTYYFPIGTAAYSEPISVTLSSVAGTTNILGKFTNTYPIATGHPLSGITYNSNNVDKMLSYG